MGVERSMEATRGVPVGNRAMICVTIGRGRHSSLAEEWKEAARPASIWSSCASIACAASRT